MRNYNAFYYFLILGLKLFCSIDNIWPKKKKVKYFYNWKSPYINVKYLLYGNFKWYIDWKTKPQKCSIKQSKTIKSRVRKNILHLYGNFNDNYIDLTQKTPHHARPCNKLKSDFPKASIIYYSKSANASWKLK